MPEGSEITRNEILDDLIWACREQYVREADRYTKLARFVAERCRDVIKENTVRAYVTYRSKDPDRLREKMERLAYREEDPTDRLNPGDKPSVVLGRIKDLAGVRVVLYQKEDRDRMEELIRPLFRQWLPAEEARIAAPEPPRRKKKDDDPATTKHYRADHYNVMLRPEDLKGDHLNLEGLSCEIQVTTLFAHCFSEIEHDLRYKSLYGKPSKVEDYLLDLLGQHAFVGDELIANIMLATECRQIAFDGVLDDVYNFVIVMKHKFRNKDFGRHANHLYDALKRLRVDSLPEIDAKFLVPGFEERSGRLMREFTDYCVRTGDPLLAPEPNSSDVMLVLVLDRYYRDIIEQIQSGRVPNRPSRIRMMAEKYARFVGERDAKPALAEGVGPMKTDETMAAVN